MSREVRKRQQEPLIWITDIDVETKSDTEGKVFIKIRFSECLVWKMDSKWRERSVEFGANHNAGLITNDFRHMIPVIRVQNNCKKHNELIYTSRIKSSDREGLNS